MRLFTLFIFFLIPAYFYGQQNNYLLNTPDKFIIDSYTQKNDGFFHTSFKPIVKSAIEGYTALDRKIFRTGSDSIFIAKKKHPRFWKKLLTESLVDTKKEKFTLRIDPLLNFEFGNDTATRMTVNSRGLIIFGDLNEKFSFTTGILETQAFPEKHVSDYIKTNFVAPGQGRVKNFKDLGYDYSYSFGNISYSPSSHFNFQLGHGKQFLGDGYRSLLLSDVPFYYPYLRMTTTFKRFQYVNLWTSFQEVKPYDSRTLVYQRKHGSFTYLSYFLTKKIELGLFEAIMFQSTDSNSNNVLPLDVANPIIGVRTLQYGFRYKHNALIGLTAKVNILKQITLYGQLVIDDLKRKSENGNFHNRYGYQAGLKLLEPLRIENLYVLTEYNSVRPFTYSPTIPYQNYSAFNQPLAHPAGNYFKEWVFLARYNYKDLFIQGKIVRYSSSGEQGISQYTPDNAIILEQDFTMDYVSTIITHYNLEGGIIINQKNRLQIAIGTHMMTNSNIAGLPDYVYFAIRTPFSNLYYDF